jgi:ABC-type amino acid transport substrate-binding protein
MVLRVGRLICGSFLAAALALGGGRALAEETLRVALSDLPPLAMRDGDGKVSGLSFELVEAIVGAAGFAASYTVEPHARTVHSLLNGQADLIIMFPSAALRDSIAVGPVNPLETVVLPARGADDRSVDDLRGRTVAALRGSNVAPQLADDPSITLHWVDSYESALKMLRAKRVEAVTGSDLGLFHAMRSAGMRREEFGTPFALARNMGWLFARKDLDGETVRRLRAAIDSLHAKGALAAIAGAYLS